MMYKEKELMLPLYRTIVLCTEYVHNSVLNCVRQSVY